MKEDGSHAQKAAGGKTKTIMNITAAQLIKQVQRALIYVAVREYLPQTTIPMPFPFLHLSSLPFPPLVVPNALPFTLSLLSTVPRVV